ncbi:unnamed protein product [Leuciscus chuanchicus]
MEEKAAVERGSALSRGIKEYFEDSSDKLPTLINGVLCSHPQRLISVQALLSCLKNTELDFSQGHVRPPLDAQSRNGVPLLSSGELSVCCDIRNLSIHYSGRPHSTPTGAAESHDSGSSVYQED